MDQKLVDLLEQVVVKSDLIKTALKLDVQIMLTFVDFYLLSISYIKLLLRTSISTSLISTFNILSKIDHI